MERCRGTLRRHALAGRRAAATREFKGTPWYVAAVDAAAHIPGLFEDLPSPECLEREAMLLWRIISDREASAKYMAASVRSVGGVGGDAVLVRVAPWLSEESRMRALAEKLMDKGEL